MKTREQMQAALDALREVCRQHGVALLGVCNAEGIYGEIELKDAADLAEDELARLAEPILSKPEAVLVLGIGSPAGSLDRNVLQRMAVRLDMRTDDMREQARAMPAIEYKVVAPREKPVAAMTSDEVKHLALKLQSGHLYQCVMMYETRQCSWLEAMQIAAVELARVAVSQQKELVRMTSQIPPAPFRSS